MPSDITANRCYVQAVAQRTPISEEQLKALPKKGQSRHYTLGKT
ncbi:hypothetical protein SynBIOSE41_01877 [Synechococcus sp. BIOS-E4-1]|nr:hypothetical protein SynBIOSE41_01877 [Synechococcus sp. BIOS-E4-1]